MTDRPHPDLGDPEHNAMMNARINAELEKEKQAAREAATDAPPEQKKLTREELLSVENLYLKLQNMQLQVQNIDHAKAALIEQMREIQKEMDDVRAGLSQKYGVDIGRHTVAPDGTIRTGQALPTPGFAAAMAAVQGANGAVVGGPQTVRA